MQTMREMHLIFALLNSSTGRKIFYEQNETTLQRKQSE